MTRIQTSLLATAVVLFSACGGNSTPKVVPVTPVNKTVETTTSQTELHQNIVLLAKYKKYDILEDNGNSNVRIKYDRKYTDKETKEVKLHSSITYDVTNTANDYTFAYVDSINLGYNEHNISNTYTRYVNMFDSTLKRMYSDPAYLGRMKNIVAGKNADGSEK